MRLLAIFFLKNPARVSNTALKCVSGHAVYIINIPVFLPGDQCSHLKWPYVKGIKSLQPNPPQVVLPHTTTQAAVRRVWGGQP